MRIDRYVSVALRTNLTAKKPISLGPDTDYVTVPERLYQEVAAEAKKTANALRHGHKQDWMLSRMAFRFKKEITELHTFRQQEKEREICGLQGDACLVLGAMNLVKPIYFHLGPCATFRFDASGKSSVIGLQPGEWSIPDTLWDGNGKPPIIERCDLPKIRRYYTSFLAIQTGGASRLPSVLRFYLRTLLTKDSDLLYLLHWQVLEALFPKENAETTHQLCERAVSIIAPFGPDRTKHYHNLKRLYGLRSALVHGRGCTFTQEHKKMAEYVRMVLRSVLTDRKHVSAFAAKDDNLREYLLTKLLGGDTHGQGAAK